MQHINIARFKSCNGDVNMAKIPKKIQKFLGDLAKDGIVPMGGGAEEKRKTYREKLRHNEEPLVNALQKVGVSVSPVWDLVNTRQKCHHSGTVISC